MIANDSRHHADKTPLTAWEKRENVAASVTIDGTIDAICAGRIRLAVTDLDAWAPGTARTLVRELRNANAAVPIVLRTDLSPGALDELSLMREFGALSQIHVSYRQYDPLGVLLSRDAAQFWPSGALCILHDLLDFVPMPAQRAFVATTVLCERLVNRREVEAVLGTGPQKLRCIYDLCGFPRFPDLNAELLAAHALVAFGNGGSHEQCAVRAGLERHEFDRYLARHFDGPRALENLLARGGVAARTRRIAAWVAASK